MLCLNGVVMEMDEGFALAGEEFYLHLHFDEYGDEIESVEWVDVADSGATPPAATQEDLEDARVAWKNSFQPFVQAYQMYGGRDPLDKRAMENMRYGWRG